VAEPSLGQIAWFVTRDVNRTFGGGIASMELLRRTCMARGWLDQSDHALLVAISRLTPGTNLLAYCVGLGWGWRRLAGAGVALAAASLPSAAIVSVLGALIALGGGVRFVQLLLAVATIAAAGLVFSAAWHLIRPHLTGTRRVWTAIGITGVIALHLLEATPVRALLAAAVWGALTPRRDPS
jgi:chromate transporter